MLFHHHSNAATLPTVIVATQGPYAALCRDWRHWSIRNNSDGPVILFYFISPFSLQNPIFFYVPLCCRSTSISFSWYSSLFSASFFFVTFVSFRLDEKREKTTTTGIKRESTVLCNKEKGLISTEALTPSCPAVAAKFDSESSLLLISPVVRGGIESTA